MKTYNNYWNRKSRDEKPLMAAIDQIINFYLSIKDDRRITTSHISIYMALFGYWNMNNGQNPVSINRNDIMKMAKINGLGTYHKCIKDLKDFGYIEYKPSYHPVLGSQVWLNQL
jgi:hypothetical protein